MALQLELHLKASQSFLDGVKTLPNFREIQIKQHGELCRCLAKVDSLSTEVSGRLLSLLDHALWGDYADQVKQDIVARTGNEDKERRVNQDYLAAVYYLPSSLVASAGQSHAAACRKLGPRGWEASVVAVGRLLGLAAAKAIAWNTLDAYREKKCLSANCPRMSAALWGRQDVRDVRKLNQYVTFKKNRWDRNICTLSAEKPMESVVPGTFSKPACFRNISGSRLTWLYRCLALTRWPVVSKRCVFCHGDACCGGSEQVPLHSVQLDPRGRKWQSARSEVYVHSVCKRRWTSPSGPRLKGRAAKPQCGGTTQLFPEVGCGKGQHEGFQNRLEVRPWRSWDNRCKASRPKCFTTILSKQRWWIRVPLVVEKKALAPVWKQDRIQQNKL